MVNHVSCPCQSIERIDRGKLLDVFKEIRDKCVALKEILVPDSEWPQFQKEAIKALNFPDTVGHQYKVLGALQHGILSKITFPIHRYLMDGNETVKTLDARYKKELVEHWMGKRDSLKRHQKARAHEGKINELLCASWLENKGWKIEKLEALGGDFDIEATSKTNISYSIEIKFIGQEDGRFQEFEKSRITRNAVAGLIPIHDGYNYLLFRIYEAAYQLSRSRNKRLAMIVFSHSTYGFNEMPINSNWLEYRPIEFSKNASNGWDEFLSRKKNEDRYSDIEKDLERRIEELDELWIIQQQGNLEYSKEKIYNFSK